MKIVKTVSMLVIAGGMILTSVSCSPQTIDNNSKAPYVTITDANGNKVLVDKNGNEVTTGLDNFEIKEENKVDVKVYTPLDFKTVKDCDAMFDKLMLEREEYYKQMKDVLNFKLFYSQEEIAVSIYNIVRIDSDLSNLILKAHKNKQKDIESMVYLADQIETLENVLNRMTDLKEKIEQSQAGYASSLKNISAADVSQIEKVHKYALNPLTTPINKLTKQIEDLKVELKNALANQP